MLWTEIKRWCKDQGYKADREKIDGSTNSYRYTWFKIDDESISGESSSVSKLATTIYNTITNNKWVDHQNEYKINQEYNHTKLTDYGS